MTEEYTCKNGDVLKVLQCYGGWFLVENDIAVIKVDTEQEADGYMLRAIDKDKRAREC